MVPFLGDLHVVRTKHERSYQQQNLHENIPKRDAKMYELQTTISAWLGSAAYMYMYM